MTLMQDKVVEKKGAVKGWFAKFAPPPTEGLFDKIPEWMQTHAVDTSVPAPVLTEPEVKVPSAWTSVSFDVASKPVMHYSDLPPMRWVPRQAVPLLDQFRAAVRAEVHEAGIAHVYHPVTSALASGVMQTSARYVTDEGKGDCLVGRALIRMGVPVAELVHREGMPASRVIPQVFERAGGADINALVYVAQEVQCINDTRQPWGCALSLLDRSERMF